MFKLYALLAILITLTACGSELIPKRKSKSLDQSLLPYMRDYLARCSKTTYATDCMRADRDIILLEWANLEPNTIGLATFTYAYYREIQIQISPLTPDTRATMFHEMGHAMGLEHDDQSCIMSTYLRKIPDSLWEACVKELFTRPGERVYVLDQEQNLSLVGETEFSYD